MMHTCCAFSVTQPHYHPYSTSKPWVQHICPCPLLASQFVLIPRKQSRSGYSDTLHSDTPHVFIPMASSSRPPSFSSLDIGVNDISTSSSSSNQVFKNAAKGSGTTARGRRLLKVREEKRKREYDRVHNYPAWAKVLEDACRTDSELRAVLGDSIGNPELMRKRVEERVQRKGRDFQKSKTGSVLAFKVSFRDFNPVDSYIWFELLGAPSDRDVDLIGSVIQSWYVMGRLGAYNQSNLQLANSSMEYNPLYDADKGFTVMPSSFHDISNVDFQDNWGRVWVDLGTSDFFAVDVLLNCLTALSSEYVGLKQVVFGGRSLGDWEEGMTSPEYGYKYFNI
ncbi:uncharacterized protein LOC108197018 [Daucus carota subsp. sativus]|nr:PREDICTED: uncharacterized protein LOC108197018 [Daucus carota subsp. sativus]